MKQYLTTPIYYASGSPHLGHAYTTFVADCYKRYRRLRGDDVLLTSGTDEHGQKIERIAELSGESIGSFIDTHSDEFLNLWKNLDIDVDLFERTSSSTHKELVIDIWQRIRANGDIYKGHYEGLYCVDCEQYFTVGDQCPVHRTPLENFSEESYFFRLSAYQQKLIDHIEANPDFIVPGSRRNEVLSFLKNSELHDLSISRTSTQWGITVPDDPGHVVYVWLDALAAYLSALGGLSSKKLGCYWSNSFHFIGKDILIFHAVYWPAFLWSAGLELPKKIVVNGWLTVEGRKISKSDPETVIDPLSLTDLVGSDGLKYYFLKTVSLGLDLDFRRSHLIDVLNADLANNLGNLFSRFIKLFIKHFPDGLEYSSDNIALVNKDLLQSIRDNANKFATAIERFDLSQAARLFIETAALVNANIQRREPWKIVDRDELGQYLWTLHHCLGYLTLLGASFVPGLTDKARIGLNLDAEPAWTDLYCQRRYVSVRLIGSLFPRIHG
ncbi:MAG: methionine--tRNA ligase [Gammaproteobacteria bacterium]|nr:methionine--tRNA ligase [Gammaproteobacteria bacterium]